MDERFPSSAMGKDKTIVILICASGDPENRKGCFSSSNHQPKMVCQGKQLLQRGPEHDPRAASRPFRQSLDTLFPHLRPLGWLLRRLGAGRPLSCLPAHASQQGLALPPAPCAPEALRRHHRTKGLAGTHVLGDPRSCRPIQSRPGQRPDHRRPRAGRRRQHGPPEIAVVSICLQGPIRVKGAATHPLSALIKPCADRRCKRAKDWRLAGFPSHRPSKAPCAHFRRPWCAIVARLQSKGNRSPSCGATETKSVHSNAVRRRALAGMYQAVIARAFALSALRAASGHSDRSS